MHEWDTTPYISVALVKGEDPCPISHPSVMIYDNWPGLEIMCYCEPSADYDTQYRVSCDGDRTDTTKCYEREAIPTLYMGVLNDYKVCGERGGDPFKKAQRPVDNGRGFLECPAGTIPCDSDAFPVEEEPA